MRVSRWQVVLVIVIVAILGGCLGFWLFVRKGSGASRYGVTDPAKAALVIRNLTTDFYIIGVRISREDGRSSDLGEATIGEGEVFPIEPGHRIDEFNFEEREPGVFAIEPGNYTVEIGYSDHSSLDDVAPGFYVDARATSEFAARSGAAIVLGLAGGDDQGGMFTPPELFGP